MDDQTDGSVGAKNRDYLGWVFSALKDLQGKDVQVEGRCG